MHQKQTLTQKDQLTLQTLTTELKSLYTQLKSCEHPPIQTTIIWSIKPKCDQALALLGKASDKSEHVMRRKQIMDIKGKVEEVERKIRREEEIRTCIGGGGRKVRLEVDKGYSQEDLRAEFGDQIDYNIGQKTQKYSPNPNPKLEPQPPTSTQSPTESTISRNSLRILKTIALQQIKSTNLKYSQQQLSEILRRLQANQQVIKNIESMIIEQGNNVEKVEENIEKAYQNIGEANRELDQAEKEQLKAVNKVRLAFRGCAMGFWGFVSWPFKKIFRRKKNGQGQMSTPTPTPGQ